MFGESEETILPGFNDQVGWETGRQLKRNVVDWCTLLVLLRKTTVQKSVRVYVTSPYSELYMSTI